MFCTKCGKQNKDEAKFCVGCGQPLTASQAPDIVTHSQTKNGSSKAVVATIVVLSVAVFLGISGFVAYTLISRNTAEEDSYAMSENDDNDDGKSSESRRKNKKDKSKAETVTEVETEKETETVTEETTLFKETEETTELVEATTEVEVSQTENYIIPYSASRYLTNADLAGLSKEQLRLARNEIYARHGRRFNDASLQQYFDAQGWYSGTVAPDDFDMSVFNVYEMANKDFILAYEQGKGQ